MTARCRYPRRRRAHRENAHSASRRRVRLGNRPPASCHRVCPGIAGQVQALQEITESRRGGEPATESPLAHDPRTPARMAKEVGKSEMANRVGESTMQQTRARQILQSLIQGIDPVTSEELPRETVLQHADVLRALLAGLSALEQTAARAMRRAQLPDNVGRAWTTEEESKLVAAFKKGDSPVAIAREHGRTLRAIEARLEKLGLMTAEERTTRGGFTGAD
jgi:hypothetical protein